VLSATVTAGSSISYTWDFGDGELGNGPTPAHTYAASGVYTATVIASNDAGTEQAETIVLVGDALVDVGPGGQDVFSPKDVTIPAGGTVIWTLRSGFHSVTADDGSFLQPLGSTWDHFAHTFPSSQVAAAATFRYYCEEHGAPGGIGMAGTVTVSSAPADEPTLHMPYVWRQQP
jgi:plastocyanin